MIAAERRVAVNTISRLAAGVVVAGVDFLLTPFVLAHLGKALVGLQVLAADALRYFMLVGQSIGAGYLREATGCHAREQYERMNTMLGAGLVLMTVLATLIVGASLVLAWFAGSLLGLSSELLNSGRAVILITGLFAASGLVLNVWESGAYIRQRTYLSDVAIIGGHIAAGLAVYAYFGWFGASLLFWVIAMFAFRSVLRIVYVIPAALRALPQMRLRARLLPTGEMLALARFSGLYFLGGLGFLFHYASAAILISNLDELGPEKVVTYNLAQRWDPMIRQIVLAFAGSLTPLMAALAGVGNFEALRAALLRGTRYVVLLGAFPCVMLSLYAAPLIRYWVGEGFVPEAAPVLRWVAGTLLVSLPAMMAYEVLFAVGRIGRAALLECGMGILNIFLAIAFVKGLGLGLLGIALGLVVTNVIKNGLLLPWLAMSELKVQPLRYLRDACLRPGVAVGAAALGCMLLQVLWPPQNLALVLVHFAIGAVFYAGLVWSVGLVAADRAKARVAFAGIGNVLGLRRDTTSTRE